MKIGVLALQGAFREHIQMLQQLGVEAVEKEEKAESTAVMRLLTEPRATEPLRLAVGWGCSPSSPRTSC